MAPGGPLITSKLRKEAKLVSRDGAAKSLLFKQKGAPQRPNEKRGKIA